MRSLVLLSVAAAAAMAGGYAIPENSINSVALSAAYVANAHGADAAYFNPAAMVYNDDVNQLEIDATYIGLSAINYTSSDGLIDIDSKRENFLVPTFHFTSKKLGESGARVGLSIVSPAGLSKRWTEAPGIYSAQEFTLKTIEINPSVALPLSDTLSVGVGFRIISSEGIVKSSSPLLSRDMTGDSIDYGYNLALNYRPVPNLSLAATYRSNVGLNEEGSAKLYSGTTLVYPNLLVTDDSASVTVPVPAALNLAAAYTFDTGTTVEVVYGKTFWSKYKSLDFDYSVPLSVINPTLAAYYDNPIPKNWRNTDTYRLGVTQKVDQWTAMAGIAYDETPVPGATIGFELPDSNAWIVSAGGRYQIDKQWNIGLAALADLKKDRTVHTTTLDGEFSNARAYLVTAGIEYRF